MRVTIHEYILSNMIVLPVIVGIISYRKLDKAYRCFLYHSALAFLWEVSTPISPRNIEYVNLENYLFSSSIVPFSYYSLMSWSMVKKINKKVIFLTIIIILLAFIEISIYGLQQIRVPYTSPFLTDIISVILGLNAFLVIYSKKYSVLERRSLFLIVIPLIIINSFSIVFYSTLALYYNPSNQQWFIKLGDVSHVLNALAFICFSLAFLLKPSKQVYL